MTLLKNPQKLADVLRFGADILYDWNTDAKLTQHNMFNVSFVNINTPEELKRYKNIREN